MHAFRSRVCVCVPAEWAPGVFAIPVGHYGSLPSVSKPRTLAVFYLIVGVGSVLFAVPKFISPR